MAVSYLFNVSFTELVVNMSHCTYDMHKDGVMDDLRRTFSSKVIKQYRDEIDEAIYSTYHEGETDDCICTGDCVDYLIDFIKDSIIEESAPKLLEACEQAIEFLSGNNDNGKDVYHKLVEAVRKAKEMTDGSK